MNKFQENLKILAKNYTQRDIADKTGFSQSSINNYISGVNEPSMQFLVALKDAFGINIDSFLFEDFVQDEEVSIDRFVGNYIFYYYNNTSYKGEVHTNLKNTLNYGVISIFKEKTLDNKVLVYATYLKERADASKLLKSLNSTKDDQKVAEIFSQMKYLYKGKLNVNEQIISIELKGKDIEDYSYILLNNPPTKTKYVGGIGTVNTVTKGREHNPCVQYIIISDREIERPDGELYDYLKLNDYKIKLDEAIDDIVSLFKRLYVENNEISKELSENQKQAIIQNKLEYHFYDILESNVFRFAKVSNKEDDAIYNIIREENK